MRVLLISPKDTSWMITKNKVMFYPLSLPIIAAFTPEDVDVKIIDEKVEEIDFDADCDLVGITAVTATINRAYCIADAFRERGRTVVIGGPHVTFLPDEALAHADAVVLGEAEGCWESLLADFGNGQLKAIYESPGPFDLSRYRMPRIDLLDLNRYFLPHIIETGRGCPFNCEFCSVTKFFGRAYRFRPVEDVVNEIIARKARILAFMDDNIFSKPSRSKALFRALIPLDITWGAQSSILIGRDEEALILAKQSGCWGLFIGFESLSKDNLKQCNKKVNLSNDYRKCIENIHKHGLKILGSFVFGFDDDDQALVDETVRFAIDNGIEAVHFTCMTPIPGTECYARLNKEERILDRNWDNYDYRSFVYSETHINSDQILDGLRRFYSLGSIRKRIGIPTDRLTFWWLLFNLHYRFKYRRGRTKTSLHYFDTLASRFFKTSSST